MTRTYRILIADDEEVMRDYFQDMLPDLGHQVVAAASTGRELVDLCERHKPDMVITDIRMPELDGIDAAREITCRYAIPIILVSAFSDQQLIERAQDTTILGYLVKPIQRDTLAATVAIAGRRFDELEALRRETGDLRQALEDRKVIERAKGILMTRLGLGEADAYGRLRSAAMKNGQRLVEVARSVVQSADLLGPS